MVPPGFWACTATLVRRNVLMKRRQRRQTLTEILTPLLFMSLIVLVRLLISPISVPEVMDNPQTHLSLSTSEAADLDDALARDPSLRIAITSSNSTMAVALRDAMRARFRQRPEAVIVTDDLVAFTSNATLLAGIVVQDDADVLRVSLRMRRGSIPDVSVVEDGQLDGLDVSRCRLYADSMFASVQVAVSAALVTVLGPSGSYTLPASVRARAYPTAARTVDPSRGLVGAVTGLYLVVAFVGFATKFLFVLVQEKERGQRQYLKVLGVSTAAIWASWTLVYAALGLVVSLLSTSILIGSAAVIPVASAGALLLLIMLYCVALMAFSLLSSVFFDQAKSAAQFSGVVVFLMYSPRLIVSDLDSWIIRILSPPIAFESGFRQLTQEGGSSFAAVVSLVIYLTGVVCLALYLDRVVPSEFGVRDVSLLPCRRRRRSRSLQPAVDDEVSLEPLMKRRPSGQETSAAAAEPLSRLRIRHLSKSYSRACIGRCRAGSSSDSVQALVGVNLDLRRGQISTILGHNGAGKSTLMSILSGLIEADSGQAVLDGALDLLNPVDSSSVRIGICLQSDLLFPDLTVLEHVQLCAALRSVSAPSCQPILDALGLDSAGASIASTLSPGMRRRLSVALAFIGNPDIVFLDEPSSGMDPVGRDALWRFLLQWRSGRLIILTTHSMDGADLLSDAVVIMDGGRVVACGSPEALKRAHAPGYLLSVTVQASIMDSVCCQVARHFPDCGIRHQTSTQVTFLLPDRYLHKFAPMLQSLNDLDGIESLGLTVRSLEEVFLNLLYGGVRQSPEAEPMPAPAPCRPSTKAQLRALIGAFATCWLHDWRALAYQLVMPTLYLVLGIGFGGMRQLGFGRTSVTTSRSFSDPSIFTNTSVPVTSATPWMRTLMSFGLDGILVPKQSLDQKLLELAPTSIALDLDQLYYNCSSHYALPAGLALIANTALSRRVEFLSDPYPAPIGGPPSFIVLLMIVAGLAYVPVGFGIAILRQKGSRRRLMISGLRINTFWTARLGLDLCLYLIPAVLVLFVAVLARALPVPSPSAIAMLIVGLGLNGAVVLAFNGWMVTSRFESIPAYSAWASILYLFESLVLITIVAQSELGLVPDLILTLMPNFILSRSLITILTRPDPDLMALLPIYATAPVAALLWFLLILRSDRRCDPSPIRTGDQPSSLAPIRPSSSSQPSSPDPDLQQEMNEIGAQYCEVNRYRICLDRIEVGGGTSRIVRGVSVGIGPGHVLGLLGPNGAGKSTLARCVVGAIRPAGGRGRVLDLDFVHGRDHLSQVIGYVPQEDVDLFPSLSAYQHLHLFAHIKGVPVNEVDGVCQRMIRCLDLSAYADRPSGTFSGGNRRKLSLGLALLGHVPALVLDEPTNGLDAHARRLAWDLIASWTPRACTLLVTHDTREAERLCNRIAVMCDGRLQCLGTASHLKDRYAGSYQVDLTLAGDGGIDHVLDALQPEDMGEPVQVRAQAGARVRLQTGNLDRVHLAALFAVLVRLQGDGRIDDFAVAQGTLDDVVLGFVERQVS